jgi:YebC/PmpR family DNA-binding regulatory protein
MSGHSKWSTIKHKKAAQDNKRGQVFTKLGRAIAIAAKEGGPDTESNFKLRLAVDKAKQFNMPKANIDRAIERATGQGTAEIWEEAVYEGFGPGKVAVIVETVTDNKNRTISELKQVFDKSGGSLGQAGSVGFLFERLGLIEVTPQADSETHMLKLMDFAVEDVRLGESVIEVWVNPSELKTFKEQIESNGDLVIDASLAYKPLSQMPVNQETKLKVLEFIDKLNDVDDVQRVFVNL